jgi:aspartyl/asparaginyl beta-hydroxylase (cupin superfamily)
MAALPKGTRLLYMTRDGRSASFSIVPRRHLVPYHVISNGGLTQSSFAYSRGRIVRYRMGRPLFDLYRWARRWGRYNRRWFHNQDIAKGFDFVLADGIERPKSTRYWQRTLHRGRWALYRSTISRGAPP